MSRVLLTGGSGFIAAHVLDVLLERRHSVVTTVRSTEKGQKLLDNHPNFSKDRLDFVIVEDIAKPGAFDKAVQTSPPFEAIIHTASPFHLNITDTKKDLLDPAIIGTTGILESAKKHAPTVKRVIITSSFASIIDASKGNRPGYTYSEKDWNPITEEQAIQTPMDGYRASKTFAERAAWEFLDKEKPNFTISTMCPPFVFGPVMPYLQSLGNLNTSNQRIADFMAGKAKEKLPPTGVHLWADVRDLALVHVKAAEMPEAANKRFFITEGYFSNEEIADIIRDNFPELKNELPAKGTKGGGYPEEGVFKYDSSSVRKVLGIEFRSLKETIVDAVKSLQTLGA